MRTVCQWEDVIPLTDLTGQTTGGVALDPGPGIEQRDRQHELHNREMPGQMIYIEMLQEQLVLPRERRRELVMCE